MYQIFKEDDRAKENWYEFMLENDRMGSARPEIISISGEGSVAAKKS